MRDDSILIGRETASDNLPPVGFTRVYREPDGWTVLHSDGMAKRNYLLEAYARDYCVRFGLRVMEEAA